jgi:hypothetical protein
VEIKEVEITLDDPEEEGNRMFANLLDQNNLSVFIKRVSDTSEKRSFVELVDALMRGM